MTGRPLRARDTPVSACVGLLEIEPLVLTEETDVLVALRRAAERPATRLIAVVDGSGRLVGVVPILRLAQAAVARVAPEAMLSSLDDLEEIATFSHTVEARTLREAMLEPNAVTPTATIDEAFRKMHARHQSGLYIVDGDGRPTGYLDLLELALVYVGVLEGSAPTDLPPIEPA